LPVLAGASPASPWAPRLEKTSAAVVTSLSVVLLFWALGEMVSRGWALTIAVIYAFGTSSLSMSSQALWQHGPSQLFLALFLFLLARGLRDDRYLAATGFPMAGAAAMRSTDAALLLPVAVWIAWARPALIPRLALYGLLPAAGMVLYNLSVAGSLTGGWSNPAVPVWALFSQVSLREGLTGILLSPARGLFVYSPVFLFSVLGCVAVWRRGPVAFRALSLGLPLVVLVVGKWFLWWGGHSWGPRLLADTAPVFCFFLYPLAGPLSRSLALRASFILLTALSVASHAMGAFLYDGRWDGVAEAEGAHYSRLWSWREGPLGFYGREALSTVRRLGWRSANAEPTSADAPGLLAASYRADPMPDEVISGEPIRVSLTVVNTGRAVWLAAAPGERGTVRLGWRWLRGGRGEAGGRDHLLSDVEPGETVRIQTAIAAPAAPGDYDLVIDMVSEFVTWFADRGSTPLRTAIRVLPLSVARVLSEPPGHGPRSPAVEITTDRERYARGQQQALAVELRFPHRPRNFDAYLILEGPGQTAFVYDGRVLSPAAERPWRPWVKELPLPAKATGRFAVALSGLEAGAYRWNIVLTEPGSYHPVARSAAEFRIDREAEPSPVSEGAGQVTPPGPG